MHRQVLDYSRRGSWEAYSEGAFGYFLSIEQERSERSGGPFFLVLVDLEEHSGVGGPIDPTVAAELLSGLRSGLRGTDFVGWYRQGRVVGAVLTESRSRHGTDVACVVTSRVTQMLSLRLRQEDAQRLRVRVDRCAMPDATSPDDLQELRLTGLLGES
jgi:hypothetical protein